jgi:hypothetical protein
MYFSPRCLFCDKNNSRRHTRRGQTWKCKHCGEMNPGPGMLKAIVGRFTAPPAGATPGVHANGATQPTPKVAGTKIKGAESATKPAAKPPAAPAVTKPAAKAPPIPPAAVGKTERKDWIFG